MSPRTGRPKSEKTMSKSIKIRFDDDLYNQIIDYCDKNSITYSDLIRDIVKSFFSKK